MAIPKIEGAQRDFSAGEIDVTLKRNDDHPARKAGVRQCANFRILNSNSVQNRSGRRALFPEIGRNEKITILPGVSYFLCFGNGTLHIRDTSGAQVATNSGYSWTTATAKSIVFVIVPRAAGVIDVVMTFTGQIPKIARFTSSTSTWTFLDFAFALDGVSAIQEPFFRLAAPGVTLLITDGSNTTPQAGDTATLTTSAAFFVAGSWPTGMVGTTIRWHNQQIKITAVTNSTTATGTIIQTMPLTDALAVVSFTGYLTLGDELIDPFGVTAIVSSITGTTGFHVNYVKPGTRFTTGAGLAVLVGPTWSGSNTIISSIIPEADVFWDEEVTSGFRGWPQACFYDQGRFGLCNFPALPRAISWSEIGVYDNFIIGATPSAAMLELIPGNSQVLYVIPGMEGNEFVFCDNKVFYIPISVTNPLKPGSVAFNLLSEDGCASVQPRPTEGVIIYTNAGGNSMKAIVATGAFLRPFNISSLNEFHSHLISNVIAIAAPRADTTFQERYVYVLNADGSLAVGKYTTELGQIKGIVGWVPFSGAGALQWVSSLQADMFFTTAYTPNGIGAVTIVEVLDDTLYLDAAIPVQSVPTPFVTGGKGPLFAFAGGSVTLMDQSTRMMGTYLIDANGNIVPQFNGGENLLAATLIAGQPWTAVLEPFVPDAQPGQAVGQRMFKRRVSRMAAYVVNSTGFLLARLFSGPLSRTSPTLGTIMNTYRVTAWNQDDDPTLPPPLREEAQRWRPIGRAFDPRVAIIKDTPGPLLIEEVGLEATI